MKQFVVVFGLLALCIGCSGPTKAGLEARAEAHKRMASVNADLAAQQAKQQFEVGQLDKAFETISAAIARYNENGTYHLLQGRIMLEQHRLDAACHALTEATKHSPELAEPYYFIGVLHQRWGEDDEALASYKLAKEKDPSHLQYFLATAEMHVALQQYDEAIALLTASNQEFQHHPAVSSLLGQIYLTTGQPEIAATWFEDSRMLGSASTEALTALTTTQFEAGQYADCLHSLLILEGDCESLSPTLQRMKGKCLSATGHPIQGRDICLMVTRETPNDAGAWVDLGFISWQMGDYERLGVCGANISKLAPSMPEGALFEGVAAMHDGDELLADQKLALLGSDNTIHGIDILINAYANHRKRASETPIQLDMPIKTADGMGEQHPTEGSENHPLASVDSDAP